MVTCGPTKAIFSFGFASFIAAASLMSPWKPGSAGKQHQEFVVLADLDGLFRAHVVRRSIEQPRAFQHSGRIGEPYRIPVGLDFTGGRPARTGATVIVLEGREDSGIAFSKA